MLHSTDTKPSDSKSSDRTNNAISESDKSIESSNVDQPETVRRRYRTDVSKSE